VGPPTSRHPRRQLLAGDWDICATPPGVARPQEAHHWQRAPGPWPAAAVLRHLGQWSLNEPAPSFDGQDWHYRLRFDAPDAGRDGMVMGFDGLATMAKVSLNGEELLNSSNMFVAHEREVGTLLRPIGNELSLCFPSLDAELQQRRPRPRWRTPMVAHQQLRWIRTTLLGRTPGWSPPAPVVGPWRGVWIERRDGSSIREVRLVPRLEGTVAVLHCRLQLDIARQITVDLRLTGNGQTAIQRLGWNEDAQCFTGELRLRDAHPWWPHTHGEPALYQVSAEVHPGDQATRGAQPWVVDLGRVGFRSIVLDTSNDGFSLSVNGVPIFCRGACWTPLDPVTLSSTPSACRTALVQARTAGMNMLRVAGTTVYEEDHFYDTCDELGLLVWQDFMFANMDYPAHDAPFAASVELEVRQQLRRLQARPCLAVLCGNSEAEQQAAMWGAPRDSWSSPLFAQLLKGLCEELAPGTPYWPSSAHGGAFPHQANAGTTSYYGIGAYLRPLEDARRSQLRFATECLAFANIPGAAALARMPGGEATRVQHPHWKQRSPRDLGAGWDFDDVRDHYLQLLFRTDPQRLRAVDHDRYLALGRLASAEAMAASFAEWRRPGSNCSGALVLMLRDFWAGAGWGVVDDAGAPKACWHALKRILQPLTLFITDEGVNGLFLHVANETGHPQAVEIALDAWRGGDVKVACGTLDLTVAARSAQSIPAVQLLDHFMDLGYAYQFGPRPCDAVIATLRTAGGERLARAFHFPGGLPADAEPDVGLAAEIAATGMETVQVTVRTKRLALGVHFDMPGFIADDEHFHLPPAGEARVTLHGSGPVPAASHVHAVNSTGPGRIVTPSAQPTVSDESWRSV
jgi:beta-mannosidase